MKVPMQISGANSIMTPNLDAGEIFREPGSLLLAMMEDLRRKPPVGVAIRVPQAVRNAAAIIADGSALITFDPPANARTAQITSYSVRNLKTDQVKSATESPIIFTGLKNGTSYSFSIVASNTNGTSDAVITAPITPQVGWKRFVIDDKADAKHVTSTIFNGKPLIAYTDEQEWNLKNCNVGWKNLEEDHSRWSRWNWEPHKGCHHKPYLALRQWIRSCTAALHIFYSENEERDLHYATYRWKEIYLRHRRWYRWRAR
jgi:hypothetical protein